MELFREPTSQSLVFLPWPPVWLLLTVSTPVRFGNRYFENLDPAEEVPGQQMARFSFSAPVLTNPVQAATDGSTTPR